MRVIAGERKGLRLTTPPKGNPARPTEDKIKEAVFNIIQPIQKGAICCDLFASTGQIGIEFLSRGAEYCIFSEKSRRMGGIIRENLDKAHYEDRAEIYIGDFRNNIAQSPLRFDYVYIDPPFYQGYEDMALETLARLQKLRAGARVIVESGIDDEVNEDLPYYEMVFKREYKSQCIRIFMEKRDENNLPGQL